MGHINRIQIEGCRNVASLDLELADGGVSTGRRHLVLTGPNGSGKSGVLLAIATEITHDVIGAERQVEQLEQSLKTMRAEGQPTQNIRRLEEHIADTKLSRPGKLSWNVSIGDLAQEFSEGRFICVYLDAKRHLSPPPISGPSALTWEPKDLLPMTHCANSFLQFMVNKQVERAFSIIDKDQAALERLDAWFVQVLSVIRRVFDDDTCSMTFDRRAYNFRLKRRDGYEFDLRTLADGHAAVLSILAEILLRVDVAEKAARNRSQTEIQTSPSGVVIIDEIETHLHLKLQEDILPFLTNLFPRLQFILATHSPIVISSIPGALVYDFAKNEAAPSEDFQGVRYGALMTAHFGIKDDVDSDSVEKLAQLRALASEANPTTQDALNALAADLARRSASMALEVWMVTKGKLPTSSEP